MEQMAVMLGATLYAQVLEALEFGDRYTTPEDILGRVQANLLSVARTENSIMFVRVDQRANGRTCTVELAAGDLEELLGLADRVKRFAVAAGCDRICMSGRRGWQRVLERLGAVKSYWAGHVLLPKEMDDA